MLPLQGKHIIVGISGGIAAYKAPILVRLLVKAGAEVQCAVTEHALQFVTELTLETVSGHRVYSQLFDHTNPHSTEHISLKDWGDAMVVAPATANIIGKMANGIGDDALSTLLLSFRKPLFVCPAMNTQMLESFAYKRNIQYLRDNGVSVIESTTGELACGTSGNGRMEEPENIVRLMVSALSDNSPLSPSRHILITAGPTYEKIDAVRFIGNFSTGKMGYALAEELASRGCRISLISGPTHLSTLHPSIERIDIMSAREMYDAATRIFPSCDAAILSAAVADFRPENAPDYKIKKNNDSDGMTLNLIQNPDILATLGKIKSDKQILAGFALETDNELENAQKKLVKKNLDFIVLNSLHDKGAGFGHDTNKVTIIDRNGDIDNGELKSKQEVASDIADKLFAMMGV
ncbi:MAG: bifunctional phosphopantothenoylcysteine decarboxylase/phosphopantothenate--cysteine ligase CoaBC [Bacteroidales bacterium]|nr:bifunctional phosphopantothenoylcysteine decarboxylase/phosphopantothenate--cysteine ligase CoaBC [Bacteroidales bacterium]